ncbi:MutS-related protein [Flavihumibacter petaseus]|uniref:DNA mismatch repair proteins mutS family domain-containing protein n=1 Tax=Flavihumibacter petaseus NBRC 106054 TaxID=1220578 RepID=A0A0E9N065_9BACT|nr:hypothetical protein [Flavihumibacter petaseus]GAO43173.1 hypothetical protein FPE01S_02_02770 [Flavihumibacter petaseus NBRC 106054]
MKQQDYLLFYRNFHQTLSTQKSALTRRKNQVAVVRLLIVGISAAIIYFTWPLPWYALLLLLVIAIGSFLFLVTRTLNLQQQIDLLTQQIDTCSEELTIAQHQFHHRFDGKSLQPHQHDYAGDLDLFGPASLYQYLQRCPSEPGRQVFADWLLAPATAPVIALRQEAAGELARQPEYSILLQATGQLSHLQWDTAIQLQKWLSEPAVFRQKFWKLLAIVFPIISVGSLFAYWYDLLNAPRFYFLILIYIIVAFAITRKVIPAYKSLNKVVPQLSTLSAMLKAIESGNFTASYLTTLQQRLVTSNHATTKPINPKHLNNTSASSQIRLLHAILDRFDYRLNPLVFLPLNVFLLWDLQQILRLEKWKQLEKDAIPDWFRVIGETEAINSIGRATLNHPGWHFPEITEKPGTFQSTGLGHPLIPEKKRVTSDYATSGRPAVSLITGSNMAGKSTFLRSIGVNQVLAMAGAPACAAHLTVSPMRIMSSMRIADNLEENASTFYAELSKLKTIIEAVNRQEPVFFLLDEILRGTNSHDRQAGSRALVLQLIRHHGAGLLATHDLSLTELAKDHPDTIRNYHFDVSVEGEELYFDYKLKDGICTSMNASILMKKIGIELE